MKTFWKKAGLGVALAATAMTVAAAPASAQRYYHGYHGGYYHHGGDAAGAALLGGIVGLGIGAAIASDRGPYYDRGYYAPPPPPPGYYGYDRGYDGYRRCWTERRYDPYYGGPVRVRVCN